MTIHNFSAAKAVGSKTSHSKDSPVKPVECPVAVLKKLSRGKLFGNDGWIMGVSTQSLK